MLGLTVVLVSLAWATCSADLIINGGFESPLSDHWQCHTCSMKIVTSDSHSGHSALKVTSRTREDSGPGQTLHVQGGARYKVQAYVKQLNDDSNSLFQNQVLRMVYTYGHGGGQETRKVALRSMIRSVDGWFSMVGYIITPNKTITSAELRHLGPASGINYLVDGVSVTEVPENVQWRQQADLAIDQLRKGDITLRFHLPSSIHPSDVSVQIDHKKHHFRFGSMVRDEFLLDPQYKGYQDIVYSLFNMATLQSFKWKFDKGTQSHPNYTEALTAMHTLKAHGLEVRGHNLFWGFTKNMPTWVPPLHQQALNQSVQDRLHYMANITKGQLAHWDVMNELLHGQWFEERFQDPDFSQRLFSQVKALDPRPTLMLNDFHVITLPDITDAYMQQAKQFLANGVPLEALGIQSHFKDEERPDPTIIKNRLDHLAESGLPLWITELTLMSEDAHERADLYERVYRLYFSHPAVHGIVLWGLWDQQTSRNPHSSLVDGPHYTFNEAGNRVARLIQEEWSTHVHRKLPASGSTNVNVRGFKGDYDVIVRVKGVPVKVKSFSLTGSSVGVGVTLTGHEAAVTIPPPVSTVVPPATTTPTPTLASTHTSDHTLGTSTSSSTSSSLHCVARWSPISSPGDDQRVHVSCHHGEVLTGCSSILKNRDWHKDGEKIEMRSGVPTCVAINGFHSTGGVQAVAVCCKSRGLTCTYRAAGPSSHGTGVTLHSVCPSNQRPLGCSAKNVHSAVGRVSPSGNTCQAHNLDLQGGVSVYGACCSAPLMSCVTVTSSPSGPNQGDVAHVRCDANYVMTSCHELSDNGKSSGAFMSSSAPLECQAFNGAQLGQGQTGVKAVATCCKIVVDSLIGR